MSKKGDGTKPIAPSAQAEHSARSTMRSGLASIYTVRWYTGTIIGVRKAKDPNFNGVFIDGLEGRAVT